MATTTEDEGQRLLAERCTDSLKVGVLMRRPAIMEGEGLESPAARVLVDPEATLADDVITAAAREFRVNVA